ncbi:MAG TPA: efflux RND transporter permease subunit [Terriglobales bacterium]|jgi:Cu(I)/Ag(I) efflux system membrane protein CusA/SilA|nr:efflux RND transporter permease subunit [Terriglobales bacterium]
MINRIIGASVRNKFLVFAFVTAACIWGTWSMMHLPLDATPDLSETQVIILSRWDRSPDIVEDQVTYPIISAMTGAPKVRTVRGISDFGFSYVYVIFDEGTDIYWARSRTLEYLSSVTARLPQGVKTEIGPDATGLGWVFQYVLRDESGKHSLAELRSYQDWYLKYYLKAVPGVAEVASLGGFTQQYQINVDPNRLRAYGIPISRVADAVRGGNSETGARLLEFGGAEYMIRGRGYVKSLSDIEEIVLANQDGTAVRVKDVGEVVLGPDIRRGAADMDGTGEVVSGIVIMRQGSNALEVIDKVKARLKEIEPGMPQGVRVVPVYDRSELIRRSISNARSTLIEVILTVVLIILIFLWHFPSAVIPVVTIPVAVLVSFIPLQYAGVSINIMSLAGIAIACGELVDAAIVVVEQTHKKLEIYERSGQPFRYEEVILEAVKEVAGPTFFALLVIAVAFLPVLVLEGQEGKLFRPLAYTKNFAMLVAAVLALTLDPALRLLLVRRPANLGIEQGRWQGFLGSLLGGKIRPEEKHPITGPLMRFYDPVVRWTLRWKTQVVAGALVLVALTIPLFWMLGSEFMPPLEEGSLLYMPTSMPGISIAEAQRVLQATDGILKAFPEVDHVLGKTGRADTATDPAPLSMLETVVVLKPHSEWRREHVWYSSWAPHWMLPALRHITADHISEQELIAEMNTALKVPGFSNYWTAPIRGRIEMLTTGIRTPVGLKIQGGAVDRIQEVGRQVESVLAGVPGTRSVFAERTGDGYFLDVTWDRTALARYGLSVEDVQSTLATAVGGENVSTTIEGRERYPINVRYKRDFRSDLAALGNVPIPVSGDKQIPLSELATLRMLNGPAMIRNEDGLLTGYVFVDVAGQSPGDYVAQAQRELRNKLQLPAGYTVLWSGQYESAERVRQRLLLVVPVTIAIILFLLYCNTRSLVKTAIIILAVPFSAVGALWMVYLLGYNMSIAVWVGIIALLGIDAETGVFMLLYLDLAYEKAKREHLRFTRAYLYEAIVEGAAKRLRPKFMTFATMSVGLIPILWSTGTGSEIMKRIAAPMVGGIVTSFILELLVYPAIYAFWRERSLDPEAENADEKRSASSTYLELGSIKNRTVAPVSAQE